MKTFRIATALGAAALVAAAVVVVAFPASAARTATRANSCPNGHVTFAVEPYDASAKFKPAYEALTTVLSKNLGCPVKLFVTDNYTAEVEAMRAKKIDIAEFGPLGYIFAHALANAQPVAVFADKNRKPVTYTAALWVPNGSTITKVADLKGHTVAFADPGSTSGNLLPRLAMIQAGLNPNKDVKIEFAGSHTASLLALVNGKVDAGEVNSQQESTATAAGQFDTSKFHTIWRSTPVPNDPITVRGDLPASFKAALKTALFKLTPAQLKLVDTELGVDSGPLVPANDAMYNIVRAVVKKENLKIKDIG